MLGCVTLEQRQGEEDSQNFVREGEKQREIESSPVKEFHLEEDLGLSILFHPPTPHTVSSERDKELSYQGERQRERQ